jgi:hypothetical protein
MWAADVFAVPQDGRRAQPAALQPGQHRAGCLCLADSDNLPAPAVIAQEIVEDLQAALAQFKLIAGDMGVEVSTID